jgi:hypothetical protein
MTTPPKPPTNKWRVYVGRVAPDLHKGFRSENKAYEYVRNRLHLGHRITVQYWENGVWRLYEVLNEESPASPDSPKEEG